MRILYENFPSLLLKYQKATFAGKIRQISPVVHLKKGPIREIGIDVFLVFFKSQTLKASNKHTPLGHSTFKIPEGTFYTKNLQEKQNIKCKGKIKIARTPYLYSYKFDIRDAKIMEVL